MWSTSWRYKSSDRLKRLLLPLVLISVASSMVLYNGYHLLSATGGTRGAGHGPQIFQKDPFVLENFICFSIWFPRIFFFLHNHALGSAKLCWFPIAFSILNEPLETLGWHGAYVDKCGEATGVSWNRMNAGSHPYLYQSLRSLSLLISDV